MKQTQRFPKKIIDIHSHILPQLDDGSENMQETLAMLEQAQKDGITHIIATPHYKAHRHNARIRTICECLEEVKLQAKERGIDISLYIGNEIFFFSEFEEGLAEKKILTLADSAYVLVEFGPMDDFDYIRNGIYKVLSAGYHPIIAHVERYNCMLSKPEHVAELNEMGCYIQVNAGSITGKYGFSAKRVTRKLLQQHLVHFVASDAHDTGKRAPVLSECVEYIGRKFGEDYAQQIFADNPQKVIMDEYI